MQNKITKETLAKALTYAEYRALIDKLLLEGKTTGTDQSPELTEYAKLNVVRMNRIDKTTELTDSIKSGLASLASEWTWILITEGWCGDAANIVPAVAKIAGQSDKISLKLILRDENPEIMNEYLTNGARSVPILVCLDENLNEIGKWGPRPAELQRIVLEMKAQPGFNLDELKKNLQLWYFNDKTISIQKELTELIKSWNQKPITNNQ